MKEYSRLPSPAVVIGAIRVKMDFNIIRVSVAFALHVTSRQQNISIAFLAMAAA